jgi:hypothetical protein
MVARIAAAQALSKACNQCQFLMQSETPEAVP